MENKEQISNFEHYKNEVENFHWFLEKESVVDFSTNIKSHISTNNSNIASKNNTKLIATITSKTKKEHIKNLISNGIRIFIIKGALFKSDEYSDLILKITKELEIIREFATFIFDLQGNIPVISNIYEKGEKRDKLILRPGQLIKITNKNRANKNTDTIVIDKKIYNICKKGDSILFDSNIVLNIISQEDIFEEDEKEKKKREENKNTLMRELENKVCYNDMKEINQYPLNNSKSNLFDKSNFESMLFEDQKSLNISSIENDNKNLKKQIIERKNLLKNFRHSCSINKSSPCKGNSKREIVNILSKKDMNDHPKLLIDFNQGEILKNKHKILYNEYRSIIKSKQFLSEIEENDELDFDNNDEKSYFNDIKNNNIENKEDPLIKQKNEFIKQNKNISRCNSLHERQILLNAGFRFFSQKNNPLVKNNYNTLNKKVLVCEAEMSGELYSLSESYIIGDYISHSSLGAKDITDISRSLKCGIKILSSIINQSSDILEIRKTINEEEFKGQKTEENLEYRIYLSNRIKIFAKLITNKAIMNFDSILQEADGIIIDSSVLSNNIGYDDLCLIETYIIEKCKLANKPIYFKTNCFNTLYSVNIPSVSDISNLDSSINSGIDGFILSEYFPYESIINLHKIIVEIENINECGKSKFDEISKSIKLGYDECYSSSTSLKFNNTIHILETLFDSSVKMTFDIHINLIILYSDSYISAKRLSRYRPNCRIIVPTNNVIEFNFLRLFRGVSTYYSNSECISCYNETLFNK